MTKRRILVGLIGRNIQGSLSPALFADAFAAAGIDGFYHLMDADRLSGRQLPELLGAIKAAGFAGANITYPFKQDILPLLDAIDPEAAQVGAINTVAIAEDGRTTGYNFDRHGWRNSFAETLGADSARGKTVVLIGAGGAGRAVAFALMDLGLGNLVLHDLDHARANALAADVAKHYGAARCRLADDLERDVAEADGIVNATQTGMSGFPGNPVPVAAINPAHWVADVIYTPAETEFLKAAAAKGARTLNGSGMVVHQAAAAFRCLAGETADVARLYRAFAKGLAMRDGAR
ncbi:MAG: shikimate dehydrogenase [Xanthobacteraceae bacterium]